MSLSPLQDWLPGLLPGEARAWYERRAGAPPARRAWRARASRWPGARGPAAGQGDLRRAAEGGTLAKAGAPSSPRGGGWTRSDGPCCCWRPHRAPGAARGGDELYATGELREQQAVLRVLAYLPEPARYVALAADAVRTNVLSVLEALACDNPFPAAPHAGARLQPDGHEGALQRLPLGARAGLARAEQRGAAADGGGLRQRAPGGGPAGPGRRGLHSGRNAECVCSIPTST